MEKDQNQKNTDKAPEKDQKDLNQDKSDHNKVTTQKLLQKKNRLRKN